MSHNSIRRAALAGASTAAALFAAGTANASAFYLQEQSVVAVVTVARLFQPPER
ncbi:MAG: hypothetical protein ACLGHK_02495 [Alphaproteobacteria bacterium]